MTNSISEMVVSSFSSSFSLEERSLGPYVALKYPKFFPTIRFAARSYLVKGFGTLFLMEGKGMGGSLRLLTVAAVPSEKSDLPMLLLDVMDLGGRKYATTVEYYEAKMGLKPLEKVAQKWKEMPEYEVPDHWYTKKREKCSLSKCATQLGKENFLDMVTESIIAYLGMAVTTEEKKEKEAFRHLRSRFIQEGSAIPENIEKILGPKYPDFWETALMPL